MMMMAVDLTKSNDVACLLVCCINSTSFIQRRQFTNPCFLDYFQPALNSLPNDKILDWSKLKAFADDKINVTEKMKFVLAKVENIVRKEENAGYQHFLLYPQCFQKFSCTGSLKVVTVW